MMKKMIVRKKKDKTREVPHNKPTLGIEEVKAAERVLHSNWLAQGPEVKCFENEFCDYMGLPYGQAVALSSGTAALFIALKVLNTKNKKVAVPVYACSALRNAVAMAQAEEVLLDCAPGSPNIDLTLLKDTQVDTAIVPHMFGIPANVSDIEEINVIEDCAQALGATINGVPVGLQGRAGVFSFYATKLITTGGQGGMFISREIELVEAVKDYRQFDQRRDRNNRFNFQMTDLQAAVGREQLKKLPEFIKRRTEIFARYQSEELDLLDFLTDDKDIVCPVRYRAILKTSCPQLVLNKLEKAGVNAIIPIEEWELLGDANCFPAAMKLAHETVSLPIYPLLEDKDVKMIASVVNSI